MRFVIYLAACAVLGALGRGEDWSVARGAGLGVLCGLLLFVVVLLLGIVGHRQESRGHWPFN